MNSPVTVVPVYVVLAPGRDPKAVNIAPDLRPLGWKFADATDEELVESIAGLDRYIKALEKWQNAAKDVLKSRLPTPEMDAPTIKSSTSWQAVYTKEARVALDQEKVRTDMGDEWYAAHCKRIEYYKLVFKPISATPGAGAA